MPDNKPPCRRILLAVTGLTPQVLTETLYALVVMRSPPWIPDEIRLITTQEGAERARLSLLDARTGQFHAFCRDYPQSKNIQFPPENVTLLKDAKGDVLTDIRTPEDNVRAADALLAEVRGLCADEHNELHVSIAGGRKTMGFFLGYALSLFGRPQDRLSHVLVNEPFESMPNFFFPPAEACVLHNDRLNRPVYTADAKVMLAEIPFVRLREGLPRSALLQSAPFAALVNAAQNALSPPSLRFDFIKREAICGGQGVKLPPTLLAWYAWWAECRLTSCGENGFIRYTDATPDRLLAILQKIIGAQHPHFLAAKKATKDGFDAAQFQEKAAKINKLIESALSLAATPYRINTRGLRPNTRYGLDLSAAFIQEK